MVDNFQRFPSVQAMSSSTNDIDMFLYFLKIYDIHQEIIVSCNHSVYLRDTMDETIQTLNDINQNLY
jgi:hypothetical protein